MEPNSSLNICATIENDSGVPHRRTILLFYFEVQRVLINAADQITCFLGTSPHPRLVNLKTAKISETVGSKKKDGQLRLPRI